MNKLLYFITILFLTVGIGCQTSSPLQESTSSKEKSEKEKLYWSRVDSAKMDFTEADVNFMTKMIGHHAQALVMSRLAPQNGASGQVQTLAARIINSQKDEIQTMQQWLHQRNQPTVDLEIDGLRLMINGMLSGRMNMAGMLSQEQLEELSQAEGTEFDRLFLKYMISHHKGAVIMVDTLLKADGAAQEEAAFRLASGINADQKTEIARMQKMLDRINQKSR